MNKQLNSFVKKNLSIKNHDELYRVFAKYIAKLGFKDFFYTAIPAIPRMPLPPDRFLKDVLIHTTNMKMVTSLMNSETWGKGPVFLRLASGCAEPFTPYEAFVEITGKPPPGRPEEMFDDPSVVYSLICPLGVCSARYGITLLSSCKNFISLAIHIRRFRAIAYAAAILFHERWKSISQQNLLVKLSEREKECLHWASYGKTAWEISVILSISERTVRFHLANINQKLDAVNTTQAVALAISHGLIHTRL